MSEVGLEGPARLVRDSDGELCDNVIDLQQCALATSTPGSEPCVGPLCNSDPCPEPQVATDTEFPFEQSYQPVQTVIGRANRGSGIRGLKFLKLFVARPCWAIFGP